ncbi:P-loop NTPase fold protein [Rhizobium hidalgonense]|uniref:P-loop NTPase fold protein n=1 Tax=Rhizobium hidalgonense TaxID=1538159 RepID=A0AAJ2GSQ1_9HYPH|nr:P-loop NTPase fold protein [Rhizobium hidalgonense]MDR9775027.1 P-loop NTPase fold protein [Rhizobium hidalgonense]MDR9822412.1 P-loop NTPase fold protein [Rhizobium hidalgonense]
MTDAVNEHVFEYLDYYCDEDTTVDYAVLVTGEWGSGKTHLVKRFFEKWKAERIDRQFLRVSLYGITSFRQIEDDFYRQMHPILSSKGARLLGKVGKGILKTTLKIDLDGDGSDDATVNSQIPDIDLVDYYAKSQGTILIFDDLERCDAFDTSTILGYINGYVENSGFKAIIIADETKIINREMDKKAGEEKKYTTIKEKLIGQTLRVTSNIDSALPAFIEGASDKQTRSLLEDIGDDIKLIFGQSKTNNLRLLKRSVWLLERLTRQLEAKHWESREGVANFARIFLSLGLESGAGRIGLDDLSGFSESPYSIYLQKKNQNPSPAVQARDRYPTVDFNAFPLGADLLQGVLFDGIVRRDQIKAALANSRFYADPVTEPVWKTAWREFEVSDDEFEKAVETVEQEFPTRTDWVAGELLHVLGLRLRFARIGAITKTSADVVAENKARIDNLFETDKLPIFDVDEFDSRSGWGQLGFSEGSTVEFREVSEHYANRLSDIKRKKYPAEAEDLLELMGVDPTAFFRSLCANNVAPSPYFRVPILTYVKPDQFVARLQDIPGQSQVNVMSTLKARYTQSGFEGEIGAEKEWLRNVVEILKEKIPHMRVASKDRLKTLVSRDLEPLLATVA